MITKQVVMEIFCGLNILISTGHKPFLRSLEFSQKVGPDWFSRVGAYWIKKNSNLLLAHEFCDVRDPTFYLKIL